LVTIHCDDSFDCWDFHTQELLPYHDIELVDESSAENREIWVIHVNDIKGKALCSGIVKISKRNW
jgi:hypothetical protein